MSPMPAWNLAIVPCFHGSQSSSIGIPCCGFPPSRPLSASSHSQQHFSLWACSPIPTHQLSAPLHTCEHTSQSGSRRAILRAICVFLTLSCLLRISSFTLFQQPEMLPFCPNRFPRQRGGFPKFENLSSASVPPPQGAVPSGFLFSSLLFFHPTQLYRDLYTPFQCPRSSTSFRLVFCENCCIYRCIPDASVERDQLHVHLLSAILNLPRLF